MDNCSVMTVCVINKLHIERETVRTCFRIQRDTDVRGLCFGHMGNNTLSNSYLLPLNV